MRTPKLALVIVLAAAAGLNCDDDGKSSGADGGGRGGTSTGGTGGSTATGGTGGSTATGGTGGTATGGTGGTTATGGTTGTGGTGGTTATGGTGGTTATGGTGGTTATGGMGGTSATGGTGGASASCEIPCLTSLIAGCQPMGTCMQQTTLVPFGINQCYTNGVKVTLAGEFGGGGTGTAVITYRKDGVVCYSIESPVSAGAMTFTVKNAAGTAVATGTYAMGGSMTMVTCTGGMTYNLSNPSCVNVPRPSIPGTGGGDAGTGCTMGMCQ
jgi:hypothetical protein